MVFFRKFFVLQLVGVVLTYNFSNCNFENIINTYHDLIYEDLNTYLNGIRYNQIESCRTQLECLSKIERYTFLPNDDCPSLPQQPFVVRTKATFKKHCPGYSGIQINTTQEMKQDVKSSCLNQTSQIQGLWIRLNHPRAPKQN